MNTLRNKIAAITISIFFIEGIRIVQNNGWAAGQVIFHVHVHVIPMKPQEGFSHGVAYRSTSSPRNAEELELDAEKIRNHLQTGK